MAGSNVITDYIIFQNVQYCEALGCSDPQWRMTLWGLLLVLGLASIGILWAYFRSGGRW